MLHALTRIRRASEATALSRRSPVNSRSRTVRRRCCRFWRPRCGRWRCRARRSPGCRTRPRGREAAGTSGFARQSQRLDGDPLVPAAQPRRRGRVSPRRRVFARPAARPDDEAAFLNPLREQPGDERGALDSVALLTQLLLVARTAPPSPHRSRLTSVPGNCGAVPDYELSRRGCCVSLDRRPGALRGRHAGLHAVCGKRFLLRHATRLDAEPVIAPLATRCSACRHGRQLGR